MNQHVIRRNKKTGAADAPITCKSTDGNDYAQTIIIYDADGNEAARVIHDPDPIQSIKNCGFTVWVETKNEVEVLI